MNFRETLKSIGIIPVIQINDAEKAVPLALALSQKVLNGRGAWR